MKPHHKHSDIEVYFSGQFNHSPHCLFILVGCWSTCSHESSSPLRCNTYSILFIVIVYGVTPLNSGLRRLLRSRPRASIWPAHRRCNSYHWINLLYICKCMYICIYIYIYGIIWKYTWSWKTGWPSSGLWRSCWRRSSRKWKKLKRRSFNWPLDFHMLILCGTCVQRRIPHESLHAVHSSWRPTIGDEAVARWKTGC